MQFRRDKQLDTVNLAHMTRNGRTHFLNRRMRARRARSRAAPSSGRVYDPTLGRFISADPTIQAPFMSQSLNHRNQGDDKIAGSDFEQPPSWPRSGDGGEGPST
jgi:hypothetical protein